MNYGIANKDGQPRSEEINRIVEYAVENGIYYFDTAQSYGESESALGVAIGKLENKTPIKVISKLSPNILTDNENKIIHSVENSLDKLNISQLYGFLAHRVEMIDSIHFQSAVVTLKSRGQILKGGVSVYSPVEALKALESSVVEILQIPFNILDKRWVDLDIFQRAEDNNVQLFMRSIFLQGLIFLSDDQLEKKGMDWAKPYLNQFHKLVSETSLSVLELSFGILSSLAENSVIIMGIDSFDQLEENVKMIDVIPNCRGITAEWWKNIPAFPERLLNPALWN